MPRTTPRPLLRAPALLVGAAAAIAAGILVPSLRAGPSLPAPARVQAVEQEFTLTPSRPSVRHGEVIVDIVNFGQDPHDLVLQRVGGGKPHRVPVLQPGSHAELDVWLARGSYRLFCSLPGHAKLGMYAPLVVR